MTRDDLPGWERLHEPDTASDSDASEPCPWCARPIWPGSRIVRHNIELEFGMAPLAVLHAVCSREQIDHEENFG